MNPIKQKLSLLAICKGMLIGWVLVLSVLVFSNLGATAKLMETVSSVEQNMPLQAVESRIAELSEQLLALQRDPLVRQVDLTDVQNELRGRIQSLSEQLSSFALHGELLIVKSQLEELRVQIQAVQQQQQAIQVAQTANRIAQSSQSNVAQANRNRTENTNSPPFQLLSIDLRNGERVLSVLPAGNSGSDAIGSVLLLSVGDSLGSWHLQSIDEYSATFKVGSQTYRLTIPAFAATK